MPKSELMKIDLHMHTTVSDGTDAPEAILAKAREKGLWLFAVTDHDAVKGCRIIQEKRSAGDPKFLTGVEFSCRDGEGKYHILGYGFDPDSPAILRVVETGHGFRMAKLGRRLDFLKQEFGFAFSEEEVAALYALDNPGKPHIGNLMARHGYAASKNEAIEKYLNRLRGPSEHVRPEEAIAGILGAGGIPVLAHPSFGDGGQHIVGEDMDRRLRRLMGFGLRGVEAFYSGFSPELRAEMLAFAERYDLYVTAGSDYHGANKSIALGDTGLDEAAEVPDGLTRFLEAAGIR